MAKRISFFFHIILFFLLFCNYSKSSELKIVPLKKPILSKEVIKKKISKNIIKPKKKPAKKLKKNIIAKDEKIKPQKKPISKEEKQETTVVKKTTKIKPKKNKISLILPKNKPLIVKKEKTKTKKTSKVYKKKDFEIASKAIISMKKKIGLKLYQYQKRQKTNQYTDLFNGDIFYLMVARQVSMITNSL